MTTTVEEAEAQYLAAVIDQLKTRGSIALTAEAVAYLLTAAAVSPEPVADDSVLTLWRALLAATPDVARTAWRSAWDQTPPPDRLALCVLAAKIPGLDDRQPVGGTPS